MRRLAALALALALAAPAAAGPPERRYDPLSTSDLEDLARRLRRHVPLLRIRVEERDDEVLAENPRTGYGAILPGGRVVALSFLLEGAEAVTLVGPKGEVPARIRAVDHERRVALLEPEAPLEDAGLAPVAGVVPAEERAVGMPVFALVSTLELAGVMQGVLTHTGEIREYEGHPRIDLALTRGMPVFDDRARFLGYSRVVAWDHDRRMIIPPEKIRATASSTAAPRPPPTPRTPKRPWWAK